MADENVVSALMRMIGAKPGHSETVAMSPANALRKSIVRGAQSFDGLVAAVTQFSETRVGLSRVVQDLPEQALLMLMENANGAVGLAIVDTQFLAATLEHSTTGRVVPNPADARAPTRTDAVIVSSLINDVLALFDELVAAIENAPGATGFRYVRALDEPRAITLALDEMPYRKYDLTVDFGRGAKLGRLQLVFPWFNANAEQLDGQRSLAWKTTLRDSVLRAEAPIDAILHRFAMSLSDVTDWSIGTVVPIPAEALEDVSLEGQDGKRVASAKLGQATGMRAVRILPANGEDPSEKRKPPLVKPLTIQQPEIGQHPSDDPATAPPAEASKIDAVEADI